MEYWIYKESRILGPFDKAAVSEHPGVDSGTLVCAGNPDSGAWRPAGDHEEFRGLPLVNRALGYVGDFPALRAVRDRPRTETASLGDDDVFAQAPAEELFQDAELKRKFAQELSVRPLSGDVELRRSREKVAELTVRLEILDQRFAELERGQGDLKRRLIEKDLELRRFVESRATQIPASVAAPVDVAPPAPAAAPVVEPSPPVPPIFEAPVSDQAAVAPLPLPPLSPVQEAAVSPMPVPPAPVQAAAVPPSVVVLTAVPAMSVPMSAISTSAPSTVPSPAPVPAQAFVPPPPPIVEPSPIEISLAPAREPVAIPAPHAAAPPTPEPPTPEPPTPEPPTPEPLTLAVRSAPPAAPVLQDNPPPTAPNILIPTPELSEALAAVFTPLAVAQPEPVVPQAPAPIEVAAESAVEPPAAAQLSARADLPEVPSFYEPAPEPPEPPVMRREMSFGKTKSFKIVQTVKSFKVVGSDIGVMSDAPAPAAEPALAAIVADVAPVQPMFVEESAIAAAPDPVEPEAAVEAPRPMFNPFSMQAPQAAAAAPEPASINEVPSLLAFSPPNTMSMGAPMIDAPSIDAFPALAVSADIFPAIAASPDELLARFAKPSAPPVTEWPKKAVRNNKPIIIGVVAVVSMLMAVGVIFMRQPKDDLKHMTALDDGKAPIGALNLDEGAGAALAPVPAPAPASAPKPQEAPASPGPSVDHEAAIAMVKDFPLDGERGTVGRWLQYSYTASPGAGTEEWNASTTADKTVLVEYRLVPRSKDEKRAIYLFEADVERGLVIGKNLEARQMLAGSVSSSAPRARKNQAAKKVKRPLPARARKPASVAPPRAAEELRASPGDEGAFGSDPLGSVSPQERRSEDKPAVKKAPRVDKKPATARAGGGIALLPLPDAAELATSTVDEDAFGTAPRSPVYSQKTSRIDKEIVAEKAVRAVKKTAAKKPAAARSKSTVPLMPLPQAGAPSASPVDEDAFGSGL